MVASVVLYEDTTISAYVKAHESSIMQAPWAMLVCLDSSYDTAAVMGERVFQQAVNDVARVGHTLMFSGDFLVHLVRQRYFCGFDEVWLFSTLPVEVVPREFSLQSPFEPESVDLTRLTDWMTINNALVGLGDGQDLATVSIDPEKWQTSHIDPTSRWANVFEPPSEG